MSLQFREVVAIERLDDGDRFQLLNSKERKVFTYKLEAKGDKAYQHTGKADREPWPRIIPPASLVIFLRHKD